MSETTTQEPTMEEILASIRRIISEDDQPAAASSASESASPPHGDDEGEVLELTHKVEPTVGGDLGAVANEAQIETDSSPAESVGDLDVFDTAPTLANQTASAPAQTSAPAAPEPKPQPTAKSGTPMRDQALVSDHAAEAAASRFGALEQTVQLDRGVAMPSGQTMDQVIRDMLNPMLKAWLDQHLEAIVDAKVQQEVERISRRR